MDSDELVHGSGNVWEDFGYADTDMRQAKGQLAARIIAALDQRQLTTRKAHALTGFAAADFSRVRNADLRAVHAGSDDPHAPCARCGRGSQDRVRAAGRFNAAEPPSRTRLIINHC